MKAIHHLIVVIFIYMSLNSCCFFPYPIAEDSFHVCDMGIAVKQAYIEKYPLGPDFFITLQIDCDTTMRMYRQDIKAYYGTEEVKDTRLAGGVELYPMIVYKDTVRLLMPKCGLTYMKGINSEASIQPRDSISLIKGTNYIVLFVKGCEIKHSFKETVTCTFRPQWASEEIKLLEIYPPKVVRKMRKETKDQTESINR